ncbi:MAG: TolC family protein [Rhabdochlamydiaceae bacterium]|nr:TolC family protein [Candidatus Amphrikana amoebophyrae]
MKKNIIIMVVLFFSYPITFIGADISNQDSITEDSDEIITESLEDYLETAASNNQELEAAFNEWKAALEIILEVDVLPDPRFTFRYFIVPIQTLTGPQQASFSLTQTFPWMGKLNLKGKKAKEKAYVYKAKFDKLLLDINLKVKKAYYEFAYLVQAIIITEEILDILRYIDNVARSAYSTGDVPYSDLIRTQVELGIVEDQIRTLQDLVAPTSAKLNAAMNLPMDTVLAMPSSIPILKLEESNEILKDFIQVNNPELMAYSYIAMSEEYAIKLAKKEYFPDFTFGVETIATGSARNPGVADSGRNPMMAFVSVNVPLWQKNRRAAVRKASIRKFAAIEKRRGLEENLFADLELSLFKYRDANRKVELYENNLIPKARESLAVTLDAFETTRSNFIDLKDTERTLLELQLSYVRALADQAIYFAEIEAITGKNLKN